MPHRSAPTAAEPFPGRDGRSSKRPHPATPHQPRIASPLIASGSPWPIRRCGELLKPPHGPSTSRLSAGVERGKGAKPAPLPTTIGLIGHREQRLAARRVLDLSRPSPFDVFYDIRRHRNVVEFFSHLAAVLIRPVKELKRLACGGRVARLLVDEDPGSCRHRP